MKGLIRKKDEITVLKETVYNFLQEFFSCGNDLKCKGFRFNLVQS